MEPFYDREKKCILCNQKFKTKDVKVRAIRVEHIYKDSCKKYSGDVNPYYYEVLACPHCGLVYTPGFVLDSYNKNSLKESYVKKLKKINNYCDVRTLEESIELWKKSLLAAQLSSQSKEIQAGICLRIAWLNRYLKDEKEEKRFMTYSIELYQKAYETENLRNTRENVVKLIFDISLNLNNAELSKVWLNEIYKMRDSKLISKSKELYDDTYN